MTAAHSHLQPEQNAPRLWARFLGGFALTCDEVALPAIPSLTARSLCAYLMTWRDRPHTRDLLAGIFWPDLPDAQARRRLSQALWQISRALRPLSCQAPYLLTAADAVQFNATAPHRLDTEEFEALMRMATLTQERSAPPAPPATLLADLQEAVALYRGDFLAGFYDDWLLAERERLRELFLNALGRLMTLYKGMGDYEAALNCAQRMAAEDPLHEEAHREIMRLYHLLGRPHEALQQYERCRDALARELDAEPAIATTALAHEIAGHAAAERIYLPLGPQWRPAPLFDGPGPIALVGRTTERATLVRHLEQAAAGRGGLIFLEGEAGVGKTRLLQELARDASWRGVTTLWGRSPELTAASPYGPLIEALRSSLSPLRSNQLARLIAVDQLRDVSALIPELAQELQRGGAGPTAAPLNHRATHETERTQARNRLLEALTTTVLACGQIAPHLMILEDLHWADEATLAALSHLAPRLSASSVLIIASYRGDEARENPGVWSALQLLDRAGLCERVELAPLMAGEAAALIGRGLGLPQAAPHFAGRLYRATGGNPLFLLETLRSLYDDGVLVRDRTGAWGTPWDETTVEYAELPLPLGVRQVIAQRLARLKPAETALLRSAAVIGRDCAFDLLLRASHLPDAVALAALDALARRRLLIAEGQTCRFSHDLVQQTVYGAIPPDELPRLHRQAAAAIEATTPQDCVALARHFTIGEVWTKAWRYSQQAGDQAGAVFANRQAADHYTDALAVLAHLPADPAAEFALRLGREAIWARLGDRPAQAADLDALERLLATADLDTLANRIQLALRRAAYCEMVSDYPGALAAADRAAQLSEAAADLTAAYRSQMQLGRLARQHGRLAVAGDHFRQAHELAERLEDAAAIANALRDWGAVFFEAGNYDAALDHYRRGLALCPADDLWTLASLHHGLGSVYHYLADFAAALEHSQLALSLRRKTGDRRLEVSSLYSLGMIYLDSGDGESARQTMETVCALAHAIGDKRIEGYGYVFLGLTLEYLQQFTAAEAAYARGLALRREVGLHALAVDALAGLARVATALGRHEQAVAHAEQVIAWLTEHGPAGVGDPCLAYLGAYRAFFAAGDRPRGEAALRAAHDLLLTYAASIADEERRRAYLHDIDPGRAISADFAALGVQRIHVRLPRIGLTTGRPVRDEERLQVALTVAEPADEAIADKAARRHHRLLRLLAEAQTQGAAPTVAALADALAVGQATIKRDLAGLRAAGQVVRTRGSHRGRQTGDSPKI